MCINEMLRILKPDGVLYIKAPDYNYFYEPHYRIPFLPKMNKLFAARNLKLIGRPIIGLDTLNWINEKDIINSLNEGKYRLTIEQASLFHSRIRKAKIRQLLPRMLKHRHIVAFFNKAYELKFKLFGLFMIGRREKNIDLWVTKHF